MCLIHHSAHLPRRYITLTRDECEDMILTAVILVNKNEIFGLSWQYPYIVTVKSSR